MEQPKFKEKTTFEARATADMKKHLLVPDWSVREKLALSCRMLAEAGHESAIAGQITARGDDPSTMWTARFGLGLEETQASDFILVDNDLNVLEGEGMPNPSNRFHLWVYRARPDVRSIMHTHPPYVSALSMIGVPLKVSHMDTGMFYEDCAYLDHWPGPPIGDEEGAIISEALGDKRSILLAHHGQLCACGTVEEAAIMSMFIEKAARLQLLAMSAGTIQDLEPKHARAAHDYRLKPEPLGATFHYYARRALKADPNCLN
ncbi:aldolase [bacterium SCSIO 12827]|nr:aldolase [bacterium SCSIO 12827]